MSLHHTIRIFDYDYRGILDKLVQKHYEPVIILTKLSNVYFDDKTISVENVKQFGLDMQKIMGHYTCMYCIVPQNRIGEATMGLKESGLNVRNLLTIPVTNDYCKGHNIKNRTSYTNNKLMYVIYATLCGHGRNLNYTKLNGHCPCCTCEYSSLWDWFKGDEIEAMRTMIRLSSDHRDEVFDPFMGNGDTGVATIRTDRHYFGTEPDGAKFRATKDRLDCLGE